MIKNNNLRQFLEIMTKSGFLSLILPKRMILADIATERSISSVKYLESKWFNTCIVKNVKTSKRRLFWLFMAQKWFCVFWHDKLRWKVALNSVHQPVQYDPTRMTHWGSNYNFRPVSATWASDPSKCVFLRALSAKRNLTPPI